MKSFSTTALITLALVTLLGCTAVLPPPAAASPPAEVTLQRWTAYHPQAARQLGWWTRHHIPAAQTLFTWNSTHSEKAKLVVNWALKHPRLGVDAFVARHPRWSLFDAIAEGHRGAVNQYLSWCRRHPRPAQRLMQHPGALRWAGRHPVRASRALERG